jgi:hypothetical protein
MIVKISIVVNVDIYYHDHIQFEVYEKRSDFSTNYSLIVYI